MALSSLNHWLHSFFTIRLLQNKAPHIARHHTLLNLSLAKYLNTVQVQYSIMYCLEVIWHLRILVEFGDTHV